MHRQKKWLYLSLLIAALAIIMVVVAVFKPGGASMPARTAAIISDVNSSDDSAALAAVEELIADFKDEPDLPQSLWQIGQQYYNNAVRYYRADLKEQARDYYRKAIALRERTIQESPHSDVVPKAYFTAAIIYSQELHEYEKGIEYFQKVLDNWPDYKYACDAQYSIGRYYERLRNSGGISAAEANPKIEAAYQAVVEKYPDSDSAKYAAQKIEQMRRKKVPDSYRRNE
jgi:tetratricopeptide (TPR) repeat protein